MSKAKTQSTKKTKVEFMASRRDIHDASQLFRTVVGMLRPLNDSWLGKNPRDTLGICEDDHVQRRKFTDEDGLRKFHWYLDRLVAAAKEQGETNLATIVPVGDGERGFGYTTHSGRAQIAIYPTGEEWVVKGFYLAMENVMDVRRRLKTRGFNVRIAR